MNINDKTITQYLNDEYLNYSYYVLEQRALPSVIDGMKNVQRKILFIGEKETRKEKNKVSTLAGKIISGSAYHHGNVSAENAIVNMTQNFKNNIPLFESHGIFGTLKNPHAASSRYISVKLAKIFDDIYKDKNLLEYKEEEGQKIEPYYYLPIIPMVLVNGALGIAVGFATTILKRDSKDVTKKCISYLENKRVMVLKPSINTFNGVFINDIENKNKWYIKGVVEKRNNTTVVIKEFSPSMTYEKFESHLDSLQDNKIISNWKNLKNEYQVVFTREELLKYDEEKLLDLFKIVDQITENFTTLNENGKLKIFESAEDILKYFVDFRLTYYEKRKVYLLNKTEQEINKLSNKAIFIKAIIESKIIINKKTKDQIIKQIEKINIEKIDKSYDYLLTMPIYSLSKEKYDELMKMINDKKIELKNLKNMDPKIVYIEELKELLKKL